MRIKDLVNKLPFVTRKHHNQQVKHLAEKLQAEVNACDFIKSQLNREREQHEQELKFFSELARRLMTLAVIRERKPPFDLKVEMTISPELLFQASRGGTLDREMDMIAGRFAYIVKKELLTANLATLPDYIERIEQERQRFDRYWSEH